MEQAAAEAGFEIPAEDLQPELLDECQFVFEAFGDLSSDRPVGMGLGPIPWSSINAYAFRYGIDDIDEFERFMRLIRAMDHAFLNTPRK